MKPRSIEELAQVLRLSEKALNNRRRLLRMKNPKDVEGQLLRWLEEAYEDNRDKVNRLAKGSGYTEFWSGSMGASHRHQLGNLHQEPEAVSEHVQAEYSRTSWETFELVKGEEHAKRQARSRAERLRQAELELRQKGKSPDQYLKAVEDAVDAMRREAKAA